MFLVARNIPDNRLAALVHMHMLDADQLGASLGPPNRGLLTPFPCGEEARPKFMSSKGTAHEDDHCCFGGHCGRVHHGAC